MKFSAARARAGWRSALLGANGPAIPTRRGSNWAGRGQRPAPGRQVLEPVGACNLTLRANGEFEAEPTWATSGKLGWPPRAMDTGTALLQGRHRAGLGAAGAGHGRRCWATTSAPSRPPPSTATTSERHMLPGSGEYIEMMNRIATRKNEIFLSNPNGKATENHKSGLRHSEQRREFRRSRVSLKVSTSPEHHCGAGVVPNGFDPTRTSNGAITPVIRRSRVLCDLVTTENDNNQTYTYHIVVKGRLDGDTLSGTWSITEKRRADPGQHLHRQAHGQRQLVLYLKTSPHPGPKSRPPDVNPPDVRQVSPL